jgi:hypothetical protein
MGTVYRNAYLAIAASSVSSDSEGFCKLDLPSTAGWTYYLALDRKASRFTFHKQPRIPLIISSFTSWTLQESKFSRRVLRFMSSRILWYCESSRWYDFDLHLPSLLRPSKYLAPSWLWTSVLGRIEFFQGTSSTHHAVLLMESRRTACSLALSSLPVKTHSRHCPMIGACRTSIPRDVLGNV